MKINTYPTRAENLKNAHGRKMTPLTEVLIVFGTQRPKEEKEGPNKEESDLINGLKIAYNAMTFINKILQEIRCGMYRCRRAQRRKNKTLAYFFTNYDCINHACIRRKKKEMSEYGKGLQDISAEAFSHITIRGLRGNNAVHRKLKLMHKIEQEFNDLQKLKGSIIKLVLENLQGLFTKQKPF